MPYEVRYTTRGHRYSQWVEPMPRIPTAITNSIVYLYHDTSDAETGVDRGGSGFVLGVLSQVKGCSHIYVATNKHVIEGNCPVVRLNLAHPSSQFERTYSIPFTVDDWALHPEHDIAIAALPHDLATDVLEFTTISMDFLFTAEEAQKLNIGPGDDVVYVGRFVGHAGKFENMPSVRFGNISMSPNEREPVEYDTDDGKKRTQVGFLVEARSRSGYSGSPVFFLKQHVINDSRAVIPWLDMKILGMDWGHIPEKVWLKDPAGYLHGSKWYVEVHAGMMGVVPAWFIRDFILNSPRLLEQRKRDDEQYRKMVPSGVPD